MITQGAEGGGGSVTGAGRWRGEGRGHPAGSERRRAGAASRLRCEGAGLPQRAAGAGIELAEAEVTSAKAGGGSTELGRGGSYLSERGGDEGAGLGASETPGRGRACPRGCRRNGVGSREMSGEEKAGGGGGCQRGPAKVVSRGRKEERSWGLLQGKPGRPRWHRAGKSWLGAGWEIKKPGKGRGGRGWVITASSAVKASASLSPKRAPGVWMWEVGVCLCLTGVHGSGSEYFHFPTFSSLLFSLNSDRFLENKMHPKLRRDVKS